MTRPKKLRAWLESLARHASEAYLLVTPEGLVRWANPASLVIFDADEAELQSKRIEQWIPGFAPRAADRHTDIEGDGVTGPGDRIPLEYSVIPLDDDSGNRWVICRDVQHRRGLEGSVRLYAMELERLVKTRVRDVEEARNRLAKFSETAPLLDVELDSQGNVASANRKACRTLGVDADRLVGVSLVELCTPDCREDVTRALARFREGQVSPIEARLHSSSTPIEVVLHPCLMRSGERTQLRLFGLDVTARKDAERLVEQSLQLAETQRARMERFLRGIGDPVVVTDPDGQVRMMNDAGALALGIDEPLAFGRDLFSEQLDEAFVAEWGGFLASDEDLHRAVLRWGEGGARTFEVTASRVRMGDGRCVGCICTLRDVTLARQGQVRRQRLLEHVAHDLRSSHASIRSLATAILRGGGVPEDEDARIVGMIDREAAGVQTRVEELLTLLRLESGGETVQPREADLGPLAEDCLQRAAPAARERGVRLRVTKDGNLRGVFDPGTVRRALDRLIATAARLTSSQGVVSVRVAASGEDLLGTVRGEGRELDEDTLRTALDPFAASEGAAGSADAGAAGALGLGVHVVRRLVEAHGGDLTAESSPGVGTSFTFRIPRRPALESKTGPVAPLRDASDPDPLVDDPDPLESEAL